MPKKKLRLEVEEETESLLTQKLVTSHINPRSVAYNIKDYNEYHVMKFE